MENQNSFSAIKGRHGLGENYLVSIPFSQLRYLPVMKYPDTAPASEKAQRTLNKPHANALRDYLIKRVDSFVLPALIGSIVKDPSCEVGVEFVPIAGSDSLGTLTLFPGSQILFNDGQHRHAAALMATDQEANLDNMTLSVLLIPDYDLRTSQEIFYRIHDTQRTVPKSLKIAFNGLDVESNFTNALVLMTPILRAYTEREKTSVSGKNENLFTLAILRKLTIKIRGNSTKNHEEDLEYCSRFFDLLTSVIPHWLDALSSKINARGIREHYVSTQSAVLEAFAQIAHEVRKSEVELEDLFEPFLEIDWEKSNPIWESRILTRSSKDGKVVYKILSKKDNVDLMTAYLKVLLNMQLTLHELDLEKSLNPAFHKTIDPKLLPVGYQVDLLEAIENEGRRLNLDGDSDPTQIHAAQPDRQKDDSLPSSFVKDTETTPQILPVETVAAPQTSRTRKKAATPTTGKKKEKDLESVAVASVKGIKPKSAADSPE